MSPSPIRVKNIMALLPAYNEAGAIGHVIEGVQQVLPQADIVVIDDCSTDNTVQVARDAYLAILASVALYKQGSSSHATIIMML